MQQQLELELERPRLERPRPRLNRRTRADRNIAWCEKYLRVPEGTYFGSPLVLPEFIRADFRAIYDNPAGTRRAIISRARKNAKTAESAMLLLLHLCGPEAKQSTQLFSAAQSRDQAALLFMLAAKMVRMNPVLDQVVIIKESAKQLICPELAVVYRALSAEATTAFGLSPSFIVHDELGQVRGPRFPLYDALETATAAQQHPLSIVISTQAATDADLMSVLIDDAAAGHDPHTVLRFQTAPVGLDTFSEEAIRAANPAFDHFMNKDEVLAMMDSAKRMPARQAEFENLILNRRVESHNPFVTPAAWQACGAPCGDLRGIPLYAGLDLSSVADLTAFVMIGKIGKVWNVQPTFWLPSEGLREKSAKDRVPYDLWARQGFLQTTPGASVSYEYVAAFLRTMFDQYSIKKLGFDRWNMKHLKPWLLKAGFSEQFIADKFVEFGQGTQSMSPALRDLEQAIREKEVAHGNHPVLAMNAGCAVVQGKDDANRKLSKNKSSGRIDGLVALAMAIGVAPLAPAIDVSALIG